VHNVEENHRIWGADSLQLLSSNSSQTACGVVVLT